MTEVLVGIVLAGFTLLALGIAAMLALAGVQILRAVWAAFAGMFGLATATEPRGRHTAGKGPEVFEAPEGNTRGWEPAEVDARTGEVKSFVWRGGR